jgi:PAS domain-containing protein
MISWLKGVINDFNNWAFPEIAIITNKLSDNQKLLAKMNANMEEEKERLESSLAMNKGFLELLIEESPDMVWLKDVNGKYMLANTAIRTGLLFEPNPLGMDDIEISRNAKNRFGADNHTFGEVCGNSDKVILETLKSQRFLESGLIQGKMMYLEVYKFPFYLDGVLVGVGGIGRDLTTYVEAYRESGCKGCPAVKKDVFSQWEFKSE